jgi:adenosylcobyric acid synthase
MALNAYVTRDGGEMGWAQAMQAEASGLDPRVEMNPILLKPESDRRSQVVVLGKVLGTTDAADYYGMTARLGEVVDESYRRLAAEADLLLIEGAGSPAEPNLIDRDLANMAVARLARAPVLLVGDIDRGGVFASFLGTLGILTRADRRRIKGFIINKFRGDTSPLASAIEFLERKTRRPVPGVVPLLHRLYLPEEDGVASPRPFAAPWTSPPSAAWSPSDRDALQVAVSGSPDGGEGVSRPAFRCRSVKPLTAPLARD